MNVADRLHRVRVEKRTVSVRDFRKYFNRLNRADFIVCVHHAHKNRIGTNNTFKFVRADVTLRIRVKIRNFKAFRFQLFHRVKDCRVLKLRRDKVFALRFICVCNAFQRPVVGFTAARREINFVGFCADCVGNLFSCAVNCDFRIAPHTVLTACVAGFFIKIRQHL